MTNLNTATSRLAIAAGFAALLVSAAAIAQPARTVDQLLPQTGEVRLTLDLGGRNVAFAAKAEPIGRVTVPFEADGAGITAEGREAMGRLQEALFRQPGGSLILVVYGEDENMAFQRARAVRGELAERHSMDPARIIAAGRMASGHAGNLAVVDVFSADPTRCGGCERSTFRTIALDSAALGLVTAKLEILPQATQAAAAPAAPSAQAAAARRPAPPPRPAIEAPSRSQVGLAQGPSPAGGGCPRPKIIIDDYYPGGPMIPCRSGR